MEVTNYAIGDLSDANALDPANVSSIITAMAKAARASPKRSPDAKRKAKSKRVKTPKKVKRPKTVKGVRTRCTKFGTPLTRSAPNSHLYRMFVKWRRMMMRIL